MVNERLDLEWSQISREISWPPPPTYALPANPNLISDVREFLNIEILSRGFEDGDALRPKIGEAIGAGLLLAASRQRGMGRTALIATGVLFIGHGLAERGIDFLNEFLPELFKHHGYNTNS